MSTTPIGSGLDSIRRRLTSPFGYGLYYDRWWGRSVAANGGKHVEETDGTMVVLGSTNACRGSDAFGGFSQETIAPATHDCCSAQQARWTIGRPLWRQYY